MNDRMGPLASGDYEIVIPETYVRHQGPTTAQRVTPTAGSCAGAWCLVCDTEIDADQPVTLIPIGCKDPDDQAKMRAGGWVSARAIVVHASCAGATLEEADDAR